MREVLDSYCWHTCQFFGYLYETVGVVAAGIADDNRQIRSPGLCRDRLLARLRCRTDIDVHLGMGITGLDVLDDAPRIPLGKRCLGGDGQFLLLRLRKRQCVDVRFVFYQADVTGHFAQDTFRLGVSLLANVEYVIAICHQFVDEVMGHGNIGTGGVDTVEAVFPCPTLDKRRYAVCCEDHCSLVNLFQYTCAVGPFEGNHAEIGQFFNGVAVMHNLSNNVDGSRDGRVFCCLPYQL